MKLQKIPKGLLELFRLRHTGEMPDDFGKMVLPVIDTGPFYAADILIPASSAATVGALLPSLLEEFTITTALGMRSLGGQLVIGAAAATNISFAWGILIPGAPVRCTLGSYFVAQAAIGAVIEFGSTFDRIVVPSGATLYVRATGTAAGADHDLQIRGTLENLTGVAG